MTAVNLTVTSNPEIFGIAQEIENACTAQLRRSDKRPGATFAKQRASCTVTVAMPALWRRSVEPPFGGVKRVRMLPPEPEAIKMEQLKPLHDLTDKELDALYRDYPRGHHPMYGLDLGAEIERRERIRNRRALLTSTRWAALAALGSLLAAVASWLTLYLDHHE